MRSIIRKLYIAYCPYILRRKLQVIKSDSYIQLRSDILRYYKNQKGVNSEIKEILAYVKKQPTTPIFPYNYVNNYKTDNIIVHYDQTTGFKYVIHNEKRLYFKKIWDETKIRTYYNSLLIEQDKSSPHLYLTRSFNIKEGDVIFDIGAAEGNFSLDVIEKAGHIYIFETDPEWIEALNLTFSKWKDKITIYNKFVSNINNKNCITIDKIIGDSYIDLLKVDIEGNEMLMLEGCKSSFVNKKIKRVVICTYHKQDDYKAIENILLSNNFQISHSDGFMIYIYDENIRPPYLRRGLIRATHNS